MRVTVAPRDFLLTKVLAEAYLLDLDSIGVLFRLAFSLDPPVVHWPGSRSLWGCRPWRPTFQMPAVLPRSGRVR